MKGRYSSRYKFSAWIFSIARTKIADYFRERKTISLEELNEELATANHRVRTTKINSNLAKCFSELSKFEQELLVLRFSAELDFSTIASILHKNTAAVKMATYRSLRNLRIKMEGLNE
ncbi:MAG: sigma-70 family RNA polymerase sigma factor [Bellilinea sp.]